MSAQRILNEVQAERERQDVKWGEQNHPDGTGGPGSRDAANSARSRTDGNAANDCSTWRDILAEEVFEAFAESGPAKLRTELIQVAAVAVQWVQAIDRRQP